jgi:hypothetical protein
MGLLQRAAIKVAVVLPLIGAVGCISYVMAKKLASTQPSKDSPAITNAAQRLPFQIAIIDADRTRTPSEIAAEAYRRALALRDANDGPEPAVSSRVPIPKPRPKNFSVALKAINLTAR